MSITLTQLDYEPGALARVLARGCVKRVALDGNRLSCVFNRREFHLTPETITSDVEVARGLIWSAVTFKVRDVADVRVGGLERDQAHVLKAAIDEWLAPSRREANDKVRKELEALMRRLDRALDSSAFLKRSQIRSLEQTLSGGLLELHDALKPTYIDTGSRQTYRTLKARLDDIASAVRNANQTYVAQTVERYGPLFDSVESKPLTERQREACVINDDHNLVLAGAGTGKTSVMVGRVAYLVKSGLARPEEILLLAYNRDAAQELRDRFKRDRVRAQVGDLDGLEARTFHALGRQILGAGLGEMPSVSVFATDESKLSTFIGEAMEEELKNAAYAQKFVEYGFYLYEKPCSIFDFPDQAAYERYTSQVEPRTLKGELVKSMEELSIANFLTQMGIEYEYEAAFEISTADQFRRQYRPDFTIRRDDPNAPPIYLEHFALNEQGRPPPFFSPQEAADYVEGVKWKRQLFQTHGLTLVETYSHECRAGGP